MLTLLSIRDIVLIDSADLAFEPGLNALTGETGAGKSILLDSLGLATGARADRRLVRHGRPQGTVTAVFRPERGHAALQALDEAGLPRDQDDQITLRRLVSADGPSRAFINDQPVSIALLQTVGGALVEIHGQHDERGLLNPAGHRALLDAFGGLSEEVAAVTQAYVAWRDASRTRDERREALAQAAREAEYIAHVLKELEELDPQEGEEDALADARARAMAAEKITDDLRDADKALAGDAGLEGRLNAVLRRLEKAAAGTGDLLDAPVGALDRALTEVGEARTAVADALRAAAYDPAGLAATEERLFALRAMARKHGVRVDKLPALMASFRDQWAALETGEADLKALDAQARRLAEAFREAATALSAQRKGAAIRLDAVVAGELAPLKLDKAKFRTGMTMLSPEQAGPEGVDRVSFEIATNPGAPFGPLTEIASGGELSRFILALKVALAAQGPARTLIFDEIDRGVGGAVADAVGERLARLASGSQSQGAEAQVLAVTHSPQVAARADHHWHIEKGHDGDQMLTRVALLAPETRLEEIARMLSGAEITAEARAAAARLLALPDSEGTKPARRKTGRRS